MIGYWTHQQSLKTSGGITITANQGHNVPPPPGPFNPWTIMSLSGHLQLNAFLSAWVARYTYPEVLAHTAAMLSTMFDSRSPPLYLLWSRSRLTLNPVMTNLFFPITAVMFSVTQDCHPGCWSNVGNLMSNQIRQLIACRARRFKFKFCKQSQRNSIQSNKNTLQSITVLHHTALALFGNTVYM